MSNTKGMLLHEEYELREANEGEQKEDSAEQ
jgi:hypothetical protein